MPGNIRRSVGLASRRRRGELLHQNNLTTVKYSYVDGSRLQGFLCLVWRPGRVRSYVRPFRAAHVAAGPDGVRGSGPYQECALKKRVELSGSSRSTARPFRHHFLFTLAILRD
jgi:hypothetical protein